jgi:hypothetical protein
LPRITHPKPPHLTLRCPSRLARRLTNPAKLPLCMSDIRRQHPQRVLVDAGAVALRGGSSNTGRPR